MRIMRIYGVTLSAPLINLIHYFFKLFKDDAGSVTHFIDSPADIFSYRRNYEYERTTEKYC